MAKNKKQIFTNTSKKTKIFIISVLVVAIIVSIAFIIFGKKGSDNFITIQKTSDENSQFNFSPETKSFLDDLEKRTETDNFTRNVIAKYGLQIASQNPNGPRVGEVLLPSESTLAETIKTELQKTISINSITLNDLKTREPESQENISAYLSELKNVVDKINTQNISISGNLTSSDMKKMELQAKIFNDASLALLSISVPPSWKQMHADLVNLYKKKSILFETLANTEVDPIKAIVAMHELQNISVQEISLAENFEGKIRDLKL